MNSVTLMIAVNFMNNRGSLYVPSSQVHINGVAVVLNNFGDFGGSITAIQQSKLIFNTVSMVTISNNTARGIYLAQSYLHVYHPFELTGNKATECGGSIHNIIDASQSEIELKSEQTQITNNWWCILCHSLNHTNLKFMSTSIQVQQ